MVGIITAGTTMVGTVMVGTTVVIGAISIVRIRTAATIKCHSGKGAKAILGIPAENLARMAD